MNTRTQPWLWLFLLTCWDWSAWRASDGSALEVLTAAEGAPVTGGASYFCVGTVYTCADRLSPRPVR